MGVASLALGLSARNAMPSYCRSGRSARMASRSPVSSVSICDPDVLSKKRYTGMLAVLSALAANCSVPSVMLMPAELC